MTVPMLSEAVPVDASLLGDAIFEAAQHSGNPGFLDQVTSVIVTVWFQGRKRQIKLPLLKLIEALGTNLSVVLDARKLTEVTLALPRAAEVMEVLDNHRFYRCLAGAQVAAQPLLSKEQVAELEALSEKIAASATPLDFEFNEAERDFADICSREALNSPAATKAADKMSKMIEKQRKHRWPITARTLKFALKSSPDNPALLAAVLRYLGVHLVCERVLRVAEKDPEVPMKAAWFHFSSRIADDLRVLFGHHLVRYIEKHQRRGLLVEVGRKYLALDPQQPLTDPLDFYDPARKQAGGEAGLQTDFLGEKLEVAAIRGARAPFYTDLPGFREARKPVGYLAGDYVAYLVLSRDGLLYAILDSEDDGNAIYVFRTASEQWEAEAQRDKTTVLSSRGGGLLHSRMWHNETWQTRVLELLGYS